MSGFCLVWGKMLHSSLWVRESKETRLVWMTLLMLKDFEGRVQCSLVGLADAAKVTVDECREAVRVLTSPDEADSSKVDDGRRIREIHGGWMIVNHDLYRFSTEAKREFWRQQKAEQRAREAARLAGRRRKDPGMDGKPASAAYKAREKAEVAKLERGEPSEAE